MTSLMYLRWPHLLKWGQAQPRRCLLQGTCAACILPTVTAVACLDPTTASSHPDGHQHTEPEK